MSTPTSLDRDAATTILQGGGEMGERMRAFDWARTPLGPVSSWPQSLRTCVRIVLTSRQPMFVWWGDDLINLYNDPYKSIVGGKHPAALGQPARVVWREIWGQVGPRAETAMRRNEGTYDEALLLIMERHGYEEETYYTFSYSPVPNDQGGTGGIICANTDDTRKIISERQLNLLRDLAARSADARTAEAACARAAESLATNPHDLPFALLYLVSEDRRSASLVSRAGIDADHPGAPRWLSVGDGDEGIWPLAQALKTDAPVVVSATDSDRRALPGGAWQRPPERVVVRRVAPAGDSGQAGVLVAGLNPYRLFDEGYRGFIELITGQISAAIGSAEAYQHERKRAEALAEIDRAKTAFFSNVSHEFRTPLTLMLGPTEDALDSGVLEGESLKTVHRNQLRLLKLVNNLLEFARIEAERVQATYVPTDLAALTTDFASSFRAAVERAGLTFTVACAPPPGPVFVDRDMWEKIVLNLLSNAFKFTLEGAIAVTLQPAGDAVELTVSDTGCGIPAADLEHVFDRFHRVQGARSRTHEGSGIGLALVHELVRLHGGVTAARSEVGRGTSFVVRLPTGSAHLPPERIGPAPELGGGGGVVGDGASSYVEEALRWLPRAADAASDPALATDEGLARARVLVADDNADMRDYIQRVLADRYAVELVVNGNAALAAARARRPDLILTDVMMPELDGFGLLRALKDDPALREIPVVMLSARAGAEARIEGLEAGADDYLVKPFSARELVARIDTHARLARARADAENQRRRFYSFLGQAPVAITVFDGAELRVTYANDLARRQFGGRAFSGKTLLQALPELRDTTLPRHLAHVFASGEPRTVVEEPIALARADGTLEARYLTTLYHPLRDDGGAIYGVIGVSHDVTDAVLGRKALESKTVEAEAANRAKDEFLAMLGHELRNPLAPISTALQLMQLRGNELFKRERTIIERQVKHLVHLVEDLLEVSRIARGKVSLDRTRIDLGDILARALEMASPLIEQREHHLSVDVAPGLAVDADPERLAQVFSNLLANAAKYTPTGGRIRVSAHREPGMIIVVVKDSGIGIRAEMLPRVFDLFVQEQQSLDRSQGGLGLGLTIVRSLVVLHGGSVEARSEGAGRGTEIIVRLPEAGTTEAGVTSGASFRPPTPLNGIPRAQPGRRILVVDDNEDAVDSLAEALVELGHSVRTANDGAAALIVLRDFTPDIAFLDIGLPVMDGYELARRIREDQRFTSIRLVAITGYGQKRDKEQAAAAGFDAHMVKPVDIGALEKMIAKTSPAS